MICILQSRIGGVVKHMEDDSSMFWIFSWLFLNLQDQKELQLELRYWYMIPYFGIVNYSVDFLFIYLFFFYFFFDRSAEAWEMWERDMQQIMPQVGISFGG